MDDMMDKIQNILSDEESMNQIKQLASMLTSSVGEQSDNSSENSGTPDLSGLFNSMQNNQNNTAQNSQGNNSLPFDIGTIMQLQGLFQAVSQNDINTNLLMALRPHLKEDKQEKVDKAVKLLKMFAIWAAAKDSGVLNSLDIFK